MSSSNRQGIFHDPTQLGEPYERRIRRNPIIYDFEQSFTDSYRGSASNGTVVNVIVSGNKISRDDDARELSNRIAQDVLRHVPGAAGATGLHFQ